LWKPDFFSLQISISQVELTDVIEFNTRKNDIPTGLYIHKTVIINQPLITSYFKNSEKE
jgi:hypothetical protein